MKKVKLGLKVRSRLIVMTMLISLVTALIITITMTLRSIENNNKVLATQKASLIEDYDKMIKEQVEIAISMIDVINEKTKTGELTIDEAKSKVLSY